MAPAAVRSARRASLAGERPRSQHPAPARAASLATPGQRNGAIEAEAGGAEGARLQRGSGAKTPRRRPGRPLLLACELHEPRLQALELLAAS